MTHFKTHPTCSSLPNSPLLFSCLQIFSFHISRIVSFPTLKTTLIPKNSFLYLLPTSSGQGLMQEGQGGESQPSSICKILSVGCLQPLLCQCCSSKWLCHDNPVPIKSSVLVTLPATWSTTEGSRQTDWLHSLSLGHYTALSTLCMPSSFISLSFLSHPPVWEAFRPSLHFW